VQQWRYRPYMLMGEPVEVQSSAATLTSSPNPSTQGQAVTFTATITSPTVKPTGPVTFTAGKTVLGTAQLNSGKAKLTLSSLPVGSTKVKVTYYGDSNIAKSSAQEACKHSRKRSRESPLAPSAFA
jgi:Bacterial Ig-like domain (group 3)